MWIVYALIPALVTSVVAVLFKSLTGKILYPVVALGQSLAAVPFLLLIVLAQRNIQTELVFWFGALGSGILNIIATLLAFKAIFLEDISYLAPVAAFNPLLTTLISIYTLKEVPSLAGILGMVSIGIGAVLLGRVGKEWPHVSVARFFQRKSVQLMTGAYAIWALTPTFEKTAVLATQPASPALLSLISNVVIALGVLLYLVVTKGLNFRPLLSHARPFLFIGLLGTAGQVSAFTAFTLANVGYVTAVFKTNMFFTILLAGKFLGESSIEKRLLAASFMFFGILLLTLSR